MLQIIKRRLPLLLVIAVAAVLIAVTLSETETRRQLTENGEPSVTAPLIANDKIYSLQLSRSLTAAEREMLQQKYHWPGDVYDKTLVLRGAPGLEQELAALPFVQVLDELTAAQKLPRDWTEPQAAGGLDVVIHLYGASDKPAVAQLISQLQGQVTEGLGEPDRYLRAALPADALAQLAASPAVLLLEKNRPAQLLNNRARDISGARPAAIPNFITAAGLTGAGQIVGLADSGLDTGQLSDLHPDFQAAAGQKPRIIMPKSLGGAESAADLGGHGTHLAGTLVGNGGASGGKYAGLAPEASLYVQGIVNNLGEPVPPVNLAALYSPAYQAGVRVHVNGWGRKNNAYSSAAAQIDDFMRQHPDFLAVFGAGNFGPAPGSITAEANSKNALVVGASASPRPAWQPEKQAVADAVDFSSRGPAADGRIKPELLAPGTNIISTASSLTGTSRYTTQQGTSMASAVAGGAAVLLRQYFVEQAQWANPSAALLKAALICGADVPEQGLNTGQQGFGLINLTKTLISLQDKLVQFDDHTAGIEEGQLVEYRYQVNSAAAPFKVVLAWTDPPGLPGLTGALVNNLDLEVIGPDGRPYLGNSQFQSGSSPDSVNNVEQVYLENPAPGNYTIRVKGRRVVQKADAAALESAQDFALVCGQPAHSVEVGELSRNRGQITGTQGEELELAGKNIYCLVNNTLFPGDNKQIKPGSQLYVAGDNYYFVTRTWRESGLQLKRDAQGWLWLKNDPRDLDGGYFAKAQDLDVTINGVRDPEANLALIPAGFEVLASINPLRQTLRQAEIFYAQTEGFMQSVDPATRTLRLIGATGEYKLAPYVSYLRDDNMVDSDPLQAVFGSAADVDGGSAAQGTPVSLIVTPSAQEVQSIALKRTVSVGLVEQVDEQKRTVQVDGKARRLMPGARITLDGRAADQASLQPGQLAALTLLDDRGEVMDLSAWTQHALGQISYVQAGRQVIYVKNTDGTMQSLKITPQSKIYRWGRESDFQTLTDGMWVRVILEPGSQDIRRLDAAEALTEKNLSLQSLEQGQSVFTSSQGTSYYWGQNTRILYQGIALPPQELTPGFIIERVVSLLNPRDGSRAAVQVEVSAPSHRPAPQLRVSAIPFAEDYWIAGETSGQRLYLERETGVFERVTLTADGQFSLSYVPRADKQYLDLVAVSPEGGIAAARISVKMQKQKTFNDVDGHWAETDLRAIAREGLVSGYPDGSFRPDQTVSRIEFYALLARAFGWYADLGGQQTLTDWQAIPKWAQQALGGAMAQDIVTGYPDGSFGPLQPVTRAEQAAVLARIMALHQLTADETEQPALDDAGEIPAWAAESIARVTSAGIMQGRDNNSFRPQAPATRAETAVTIYRLVEKMRAARG